MAGCLGRTLADVDGGADHDSAPNIAFVTSTTLPASSIGSLADADELCNAAGAALGGTYVAWLSTSEQDAASRLQRARGWVLPDGRPVADTLADLQANGPWYPLDVDENGMRAPGAELVATASDRHGMFLTTGTDGTCAAGPDATIWFGETDRARRQWTETATTFCREDLALYCFGIDHAYVVAPPAGGTKLAFLSAEAFTPGQGLAAADQICASEASAQGYPGTFRALLATSDMPARARFGAGPWWRVDGVRFSEDLSAIDAPLDVFADGEIAHEMTFAWTGGPDFVQPGTETCGDWTSPPANGRGIAGDVKSTLPGGLGDTYCTRAHALYCLQE